MKHLTSILIGIIALSVTTLIFSCSSSKKGATATTDSDSILVCYFSATGTTEKAAGRIAAVTGAAIHNIRPQKTYTDADLNWRDSMSRSSIEMRNRNYRPALEDSVTDLSAYKVIFIGYPNWWNTHPTLINTFIESNDLDGKIIVPFMTSGGSDITNSEKELRESYPALNFVDGLLMNDVSDDEIRNWIEPITGAR